MQNKINNEQAKFIEGQITNEVEITPIPAVAEDDNVRAGKFIFKGTDPETQAIGINEQATEEDILGVAIRTPFQSYNGKYDNKIKKGKYFTYVKNGAVAVKTSTDAEIGSDVFVNNKTGEILTKPISKLSVEQYKVTPPNFFKKIIYSEDKNIFVGIGSDIIAYSEDGKTFNNVEPFEEMSYYDIIYANGLFVVLCEERKTGNLAIKWSEDGKTFNNCTVPDPDGHGCESITYGKGIFVVIGQARALWSADGKTFQNGNNYVLNAGNVIYYANNIFVTAGVGNISWSEDGKTFTEGTVQKIGIYNKIYYAHNTFILIEITNLLYSTDGKNFKTSNAPSIFYSDITYANGVFVVVGANFIGYSTDGINFTECTEYPKPYNYESIIFERGLFIAVGNNMIAYSEDGKTFKEVDKIPEGKYESITYGNNLFVAGGNTVAYLENYESDLAFVKGTHIDDRSIYKIIYANNTYLAMSGILYYSTDGINFVISDIEEKFGMFHCLAYGNGVFVAAGNNEIQYSEDNCVTFKKAVFPENGNYFDIKYIEGLFIAVGNECAAYSTDGKTFTDAVIPEGVYNKIAVKEEQESKTIVAVGGLGNEGKIAYSTNGTSYDAGTIPNGYYIDIVYANGVFVALEENIISYSTDGINFTECTEYPKGRFYAIIYANDNFIVVGENIAAYSTDGISFAETELIGDYRALANGNSLVIAVGENTAAYTYNGTNYTNINLSEKENFYCVTYGGGADAKFVAGGLNTISYSDTKYNLDFTEGTINLPVNGYNTLLCDNINCVALGNNVYCYLNDYGEEKIFEYYIMYGNYISAAYGNNIAVAAGDKGLMQSDFQNDESIYFTNCESPEGNYKSVTYANNLFVAVGENIAAWSEDGKTFTKGTVPEGNYTSITCGNGLFVASGVNIIAYSEDGKTFTKCASYSEGTYNSITYGNGVFVAVGLQNVIVSNDGKTFTDATHMQDIEINKVTFCNGLFFIIGNMYIQYSETGTDFTSITLAYSEKHKAITYGDDLFVIVGSNGLIAYSESGKSFTKVINESIQNINFIDVKYYNGNFIAVGENNLKAIFSIKKESNYLNTGFKVLTSGKADETIKIYKN